MTPTQIASKLIDKTFAAQQALRGDSRVVITVPAAFEAEARRATLQAAQLAGLRDIAIIEEPIATALAYTTLRNARAGRAVVYDLGGGTFDLAVVDCQTRPARVISHAGDPYLGGDDIDHALAGWAAQMVLAQHKWDLRSSPEVFDRLLVQCERAKVRLGIATSTHVALAQVDPAAPAAAESVTLTRATLEHLAQIFVQRTFLLCDEVLRDAGLRPSEIDTVYLAGGATSMPLVRDGVARYFSTLPHCEFDPMEVVAIGASLLPETP
jgi:molecular chaperone DnaK